MDTISIFLRTVLENIEYILPIAVIFSLVSFVGVNIVLAILKENRWSLILPLGVAVGIFSFTLFLGSLSYFFKGKVGILIIFLIFLLIGLFLFIKNLKKLPKVKIDTFTKLSLPIYVAIATLVTFLAGTNQYGGDVIAYWGFATSFANGNYPLRSPWQPDLLANHHQGSFLFEGAVHALTNVDMQLVHTAYSSVVILTGIFLLWALIRKISKTDLLSLVPALVTYFSIGAIFIPLPASLREFINPEVEHVVSRLPILLDAKNRLGGAPNLPELIYINHRAAALLGFFLVLYLIVSKLKISDFYKPSIVAALSVAIISSDEIFLPAISLAVAFWFFKSLKGSKEERRVILSFLLAGVVFGCLFFIVGSALRDSILTPPKEDQRFQLVLDRNSFAARARSFKSAILRTSEDANYFWFLPDLRIIGLAVLILTVFSRNYWVSLLAFSTLGSILAFFVVAHTYYPSNNERFLHQLYQHFGLILATSAVLLLNNRRKFIKILGMFVLFILLYNVAFATDYIYKYAKKAYYPNLYGKLAKDNILSWVRDNLPRERIFFIDGFLLDLSNSPLSLHGIQNYGLLVPVSPADIKVHTPDFGIEAIDIIFTVNPTPIKKLKISYIYIVDSVLPYYPSSRREDIKNSLYFVSVYKDKDGTLYKIKHEYLGNGEDLKGTLSELPQLMDGGNIYLDYPPRMNPYIRSALSLALKDEGKLFMEWRSGIFNYIETKIKFEDPLTSKEMYNYLILGSDTDPYAICKCKSVKLFWEVNGAKGYKVL